MAEILGLIGSGVAILQVAEAATKLSKSLFHLARRIKSASEEIKDFAMQTQLFAGVIGAAHASLQQHNRSQGSESPVLRYIDNAGVLGKLVAASDRVTEHTKSLMPRLRALRSRLDLLTRIKWVMQREAVEAMGPKMESVKTSLILIITVISLEKGNQQERSAHGARRINDIHRENKYLKHLVKGLIQSMVLQQEREREYWHQEQGFSSSQNLVPPEFGIEDALVELGNSMVHTGTVPTTPPDPTRTSVRSTGYRRTHNAYAYGYRAPAQPQDTSHRYRRRRSHQRADVPQAPPLEPSPAPREIDPLHSAHTSRSRSPTTAGPSRQVEPTTVNINRSSYSLHVHHNDSTTIEGVQVQTPNGSMVTQALLIPDLEQCLIHEDLATEMTYDISNLDVSDRGAWIIYEDGQRERTTRKLTLQWWTGGPEARRSFPLQCFVFRRDLGDREMRIILGREYLEKKQEALRDS